MKRGMSLEDLLQTVVDQRTKKRDFVASTQESIRMVEMKELPKGVAVVLLKDGSSDLERFEITDTCHQQIASRLQVPWKYYDRLLTDHRDLVIHQVNALFEREPKMRLIRTLDGKARAFLSDRYRPLDNDVVLERALPAVVNGEIQSRLLSSNVSEDYMHVKVLFTDDRLLMDLGDAPHNQGRDTVRPGCVLSNSETGRGSLSIKGFFWRSYCDNGCVFGSKSIFDFTRTHLGSKLVGNGDFEVFTDETKRKQDELIVAEVSDAMQALTNVKNVEKMRDTFLAAKSDVPVKNAFAAVNALAKELPINEGEKESILESFIKDGDYSRWGMLNAVTATANSDAVEYDRACELESVGGKILDLNSAQWKRIAEAEKVAA